MDGWKWNEAYARRRRCGGRRRTGKAGAGTQQYLNGSERRLVEALEVAAHLPLP